MRGKIFTPAEANRMLPLVSRISDDIVATYTQVHRALRDLEAAKARLAPDSETSSKPVSDGNAKALPAEVRRLDAEVARLLDRFQTLIEEIEALGGTVKDYEHGCVDFYGDVDGQIVYLCWQRGEDAITHWHQVDEGFAERQPIPVPSAA